MFGDQTSSNIVRWRNMLMLNWVAKRLKHVWSNTNQTMDTSRWARVGRTRAPNMFDTAVQTNKTSAIKHENKRNVFSCLVDCLMAFNFFKRDQTRSNSTKQGGQTVKCLVTKQCLMVFGRQTYPAWTGPYKSCVFSFRRKDFKCVNCSAKLVPRPFRALQRNFLLYI